MHVVLCFDDTMPKLPAITNCNIKHAQLNSELFATALRVKRVGLITF